MPKVITETGYNEAGQPYTAVSYFHNGKDVEISIEPEQCAARVDDGIAFIRRTWPPVAVWLERVVGWVPRLEG